MVETLRFSYGKTYSYIPDLLLQPPVNYSPLPSSVIFVNENENGEKRENNEFVNEN